MHISPVLWQFLVKWLHASALFSSKASTIAPYADALYFFFLSSGDHGDRPCSGRRACLRLFDPVSQRKESGCHTSGRVDSSGGDMDHHSACAVHGDVDLGGAALLPHL